MSNNILQALKNASDAFLETICPNSSDKDDVQTEGTIIKGDDTADLSVDDKQKQLEIGSDGSSSEIDKNDDKVKDEGDTSGDIDSEDNPKNNFKSKLDNPEIRLKTTENLSSGGYVVGFSMQGRGHIMTKIPCQDYHAFEDLGDGWLVAITSDGAGSAREAARGSKANCELAIKLIKKLLFSKDWQGKNYLPTEKEWYVEVRNLFEVMQAIIVRSAGAQVNSYREEQEKALALLEENFKKIQGEDKDEIEKQINDLKESMKNPLEPRDFNATIILLIISPRGMMAAHIGDGRMGYLSSQGVWKSLMTPHKGDEASSTVFLPNNWNRQLNVPAFTMSDVHLPETCVVAELPKAFVLMSDGCESFSWTCMSFDKERNMYYDRNEPFEKFFNPLIDRLGKIEDKNERVDDMIDIINVGTVGGRRELDDRTMLLGVLE